jgi:riboflavin-specific deaminase-like protein
MKTEQSGRRPRVLVNLAMTADGKIATANRAVHSFGSPRDLRQLYALRATADAVLCGARTVEISDATLGNGGELFRRRRLASGLAEFPLRVVASGRASLAPTARIFQTRFSPILLLTTGRAPSANRRRLRGLAAEIKAFGAAEIDFRAALVWLREKWNVRRLLCEGGGALNDALFRAGLVDEIHLTICPKIFGGRAAPTIADGLGVPRLAGAAEFKLKSIRRISDELFTVFIRR